MKVGVIGTGKMGENHVKNYLNLQEYCEFSGIYDVNQRNAERVALKYHVPSYSNLEELLVEVDAVTIAVPTDYHFKIGMLCIKHHVHMLMEKPVTSNVKTAKLLKKAALEEGVMIQVGHIELFNPIMQLLRDRMKDDKIIAIDMHRMQPQDERMVKVDVVQDLMIHDLYLMRNILQKNPVKFKSVGNIIGKYPQHVAVLGIFHEGVIAQITASFKSKKKIRSIDLLTEKGLYQVDLMKSKIEITKSCELALSNKSINSIPNLNETIEVSSYNALENQLIDFILNIKANREPTVTVDDGIAVLQMCHEISNSIMQDYK